MRVEETTLRGGTSVVSILIEPGELKIIEVALPSGQLVTINVTADGTSVELSLNTTGKDMVQDVTATLLSSRN